MLNKIRIDSLIKDGLDFVNGHNIIMIIIISTQEQLNRVEMDYNYY